METDLPHQVEVTVHRQPSSGATLVHLVNGSGHQDRSYFEPASFFGKGVSLRHDQPVRQVRSFALERDLQFEQADGRVRFTVPSLDLLDVLVIS